MRIYYNERVINILTRIPESLAPTERVVDDTSYHNLIKVWNVFEHDQSWQSLTIIDPDAPPGKFMPEFNTDTFDELRSLSAAFRHFTGIFTYIPAAGGLVKNEDGAILSIYRFGLWDLPKGKISHADIRPGDPLKVAARAAKREVQEETAVKKLRLAGQLPGTWHIYPYKHKMVLKQTFWFAMTASRQSKLQPQTDEGIFLVEWKRAEDWRAMGDQTYRSIRDWLEAVDISATIHPPGT